MSWPSAPLHDCSVFCCEHHWKSVAFPLSTADEGARVLQAANYGRDPRSALAWILTVLGALVAAFLFLRWQGGREVGRPQVSTQKA